MQNEKEIIETIAKIVAKNTLGVSAQHQRISREIATEIAAAIAPLVEAGEADWKDAPEWAEYTATFDGKRYFFEDIFYPCRFIRGDSKTVWRGDFKTQVENASWNGTIERRPK